MNASGVPRGATGAAFSISSLHAGGREGWESLHPLHPCTPPTTNRDPHTTEGEGYERLFDHMTGTGEVSVSDRGDSSPDLLPTPQEAPE